VYKSYTKISHCTSSHRNYSSSAPRVSDAHMSILITGVRLNDGESTVQVDGLARANSYSERTRFNNPCAVDGPNGEVFVPDLDSNCL
jgi:hypothetical protein